MRHTCAVRKREPLGVTDRAVRNALLAAVDRIRSQWTRMDVIRALERGDVEAAIEVIRFDEGEAVLRRMLPPALQRAMGVGGKTAASQLTRAGIRTSFNITNPAAVEWVNLRAADLIMEFGRSSKEGIRAIIEQAFKDNRPADATARMIRSSGIGLTERQALAVYRFRDRLMDDPNLDISAAEVDRRADRYADQLLRYRAETIARTEIQAAQNAGQQTLWRQAAKDKLIDPKVAYKEWIVAEDDRLCDICAPMINVSVPVNETFEVEDVGPVMTPPAHPNCRCAMALLPDGPRR